MIRARLGTLVAVGIVVGCSGREVNIGDTLRGTAGRVAIVPPPAAVAAAFPCLGADSLKAPNDTVHFSSVEVHEETGDLLGTDLLLARRGASWGGRIALAEGALMQYDTVRDLKVDSATHAFSFAWDYHGRPAEYHGTLDCMVVTGAFQWGPGAEPHADTLRRRPLENSGAQ